MRDISRRGHKGAAGLIHFCRSWVDAFGDDAAIPVAGAKDSESLIMSGSEKHVVGDAPRSCERKAVASRKSKGLICVGVLVILRVQPLVGSNKNGICFRKKSEGRQFE